MVEPYPSEKWWSSSVGIMNFPIYGKIKFMFQTNNQNFIAVQQIHSRWNLKSLFHLKWIVVPQWKLVMTIDHNDNLHCLYPGWSLVSTSRCATSTSLSSLRPMLFTFQTLQRSLTLSGYTGTYHNITNENMWVWPEIDLGAWENHDRPLDFARTCAWTQRTLG